ncbi:hypothetical protein [Moorena sp. SIO3I6]|uniref:hypothetical protein n=1 Tax=Moorena sp. SIO3I6 TaxID=2607831 RepID=UPI0013FBD311|nr:hypothetical protein [Moorena sp. SIO3I6]NEP20699.1 hypothetical protein [Moorena sp. SIO3I6]
MLNGFIKGLWLMAGILAMRINALRYYQPSQVLADQPPSKLPLSGLITLGWSALEWSSQMFEKQLCRWHSQCSHRITVMLTHGFLLTV